MTRPALAVACVLALGACQQTTQTPQTGLQAGREADHERDLQSKAFAEPRQSAAKGTKTCLVKQYTSAHRAKRLWVSGKDNPYTYVYSSKSSNIYFRIERGGGVGIAVGDSTFPGMKSFFLIGGHRYAAEGDHYADVTAALAVLRQDTVIKYAWHKWPYRNEINDEDSFPGFADAYDRCLKFLRNSSPQAE